MRQNAFNFALFVLLAGGIVTLWFTVGKDLFPKNEPPKNPPKVEKKDDDKKPPEEKKKAEEKKDEKPPAPKPPLPPAPYVPPTLIALGGPDFNLQPMLTTQGGGVQQVVLSKFEEADRLGRAAKNNGVPAPLYLIPGVDRRHGRLIEDNPPLPDIHPGKALDPRDPETPQEQRLIEPSYTIFHYPTPEDAYPDPLLGTVQWTIVEQHIDGDGPHWVVFEASLPDPHFLKIRKTFSLGKQDYHIGMKLEFERLPGGQKGKGLTRIQVSGPRQLPVEGEWYTPLTRVSLIGWENKKGAFQRQYDDPASINSLRGSEKAVSAGGENIFKYAAISTPFFASALAIDDDQGKTKWAWVRATSELPFIPSPEEIKKLEDQFRKEPENRRLAIELEHIRQLRERRLPELDDITFRAVTEPLDLEAGEKLVNNYAIYNGPTKVALLDYLKGDRQIDAALVAKYHDQFGLRTLTDFHSPTALGRFASAIYWTDIVIGATNLMHWLLWAIHSVIDSWGFSIIVLTVMVRLLLFIPSRKQTQMNMKMMEMQKKLKPELDKLHEKYKDDFQTYNREKTRLMMQHGMNPFSALGGCLLLFAQMPIMMGLYYCLQESIFFRLEPFLWIENLAAPDMTVWWTEKIPLISDPEYRHGSFSFLYLGPYLNILPLIAVTLMLYQQHKMMPPPTDEQQATQQRMMKIMMIVVAFMFYKVAAGLALYFIISTSWGLIERQLIPKPKPADDSGIPAVLPSKGGSPNGQAEPKEKGMVGRFKQRLQERLEELQKKAAEQSSRQVRNPSRPEPLRTPGRDKKRKRSDSRTPAADAAGSPISIIATNPMPADDLVVAITGASGAAYGVRLVEVLLRAGRRVHLTISPAAVQVIAQELDRSIDLDSFDPAALFHSTDGLDWQLLRYHHHRDFRAGIASGSFLTGGMAVCPCSMGTLAAIAHGISENLIHRAADVHLKERRKLVLVPRETPLGVVQLRNMTAVAEAGAVVLPAMPGYYHRPAGVQDLIDFVVGRVCDQLAVPHHLFERWGSTGN